MTEYVQESPELSPVKTKIFANLDTLEKDAGEVHEPYTFVLGGRVITLADPADLDWQDLTGLGSDEEFLKLAMNEEDLGHFLGQKLPAWKLRHVVKQFNQHYGLTEPGKAD